MRKQKLAMRREDKLLVAALKELHAQFVFNEIVWLTVGWET
jgi:hypothetical protein